MAAAGAESPAQTRRLSRLRIVGLRNLLDVDIEPGPRCNLLLGPNGAGKTSVLEALHCLASGRSFRSGQHEHLIQRGRTDFVVSARLLRDGVEGQLGFRRERQGWSARVDGASVETLAELAREFSVLAFDPGAHELVAGPAESRRRLLDHALFHVEPEYLEVWRRYQRALRQRNAALRQYASSEPWAAWEAALATHGEWLSERRAQWTQELGRSFASTLAGFLPELGEASLSWRCGWDAQQSLIDVLRENRLRDRELGYTLAGPHRGDVRIQFGSGLGKHELSRGQQKLVALALLLATAEVLRARLGWAPLLLLDDLASELDADKQQRCVELCMALHGQWWVTGTQVPAGLPTDPALCKRFNVVAGRVVAGKVLAGGVDGD